MATLPATRGVTLLYQTRSYAAAAAAKAATKAPATAATIAKRQLKALPKPSVEPPKRPWSAYLLFTQSLRKEEPGLQKKGSSVTEFSKEAARRWKQLGEVERREFEAQHSDAKAKYERAYNAYLEKRTPADILLEEQVRRLGKTINPKKTSRKVPADIDAPKRPPTAYLEFANEANAAKEIGGQSLEGLKVSERAKLIGKAWKALSEAEQSKYKARAEKSKATYDEAKKAYDARHDLTKERENIASIKQKVVKDAKPKAVKKKKVAVPKRKVAAIKKKVGVKKAAPKKKVGAKKATGAKKVVGKKATGAKKSVKA
ncbi:hypothetical protein HDV00_006601 [Rhizophlyctis rosea]|nr:hypothetical protein HDV00_006601 [Rhizophlyctis rosea]